MSFSSIMNRLWGKEIVNLTLFSNGVKSLHLKFVDVVVVNEQ